MAKLFIFSYALSMQALSKLANGSLELTYLAASLGSETDDLLVCLFPFSFCDPLELY